MHQILSWQKHRRRPRQRSPGSSSKSQSHSGPGTSFRPASIWQDTLSYPVFPAQETTDSRKQGQPFHSSAPSERCNKRIQKKSRKPRKIFRFPEFMALSSCHGVDGSRTRVRKPLHRTFYHHSLSIFIPASLHR